MSGVCACRDGLYHRAFAWMLAHGGRADARLYGERKRDLLGSLTGTVLDLGAGAGVNLPYLGRAERVIAVEPNVHFHPRIEAAGREAGVRVEPVAGVAEALPLETGSLDAVVTTLVLCSVEEPAEALAEIRRVLRPGGRFVFIEHVAAPTGSWLRRAQRALRRPWGLVADGCRPDRDTDRLIQDTFEHARIERFRVPLGLVSPHVAGVVRLPAQANSTRA